SKLYPPRLGELGVDPRQGRLKSSRPVCKLLEATGSVLRVRDFQVYQSTRDAVTLESTERLAVCIPEDFERRFDPLAQRFLIGRAAMALFNKAALPFRLPLSELEDVLGNAIRIFDPEFDRLGHPNDELVKKLKKACSRKALRALDEAVQAITA